MGSPEGALLQRQRFRRIVLLLELRFDPEISYFLAFRKTLLTEGGARSENLS